MVMPCEPGCSWHQGQEMCSQLEHSQILPLDALSSRKIILTLGNSRISMLSLGDRPAFTVPQKQETLNQTNYLLP